MQLQTTGEDYDTASQRLRVYAAHRLMELVEGLAPLTQEVLAAGNSIYDWEPGRIQAHVALLKLQQTLVKELGALYRVGDRPAAVGEATMPVSAVQQLLEAAEVRTQEAVAAAVAAAREETLQEVQLRERVSLAAARGRVAAGLGLLR